VELCVVVSDDDCVVRVNVMGSVIKFMVVVVLGRVIGSVTKPIVVDGSSGLDVVRCTHEISNSLGGGI
jgi:hypothetical protein